MTKKKSAGRKVRPKSVPAEREGPLVEAAISAASQIEPLPRSPKKISHSASPVLEGVQAEAEPSIDEMAKWAAEIIIVAAIVGWVLGLSAHAFWGIGGGWVNNIIILFVFTGVFVVKRFVPLPWPESEMHYVWAFILFWFLATIGFPMIRSEFPVWVIGQNPSASEGAAISLTFAMIYKMRTIPETGKRPLPSLLHSAILSGLWDVFFLLPALLLPVLNRP